MDLASLNSLKPFPLYSYADMAMRHWKCAVDNRNGDIELHLIGIIGDYELAIEQMLRFILTRTSGLSRAHQYSHNVWALACDIDLQGRERYFHLLCRYSAYYLDGLYEAESTEERQALYDFFRDDEVFNQTDELLYVLYTEAQDVARVAKDAAGNGKTNVSGINKMNLF